jgi:hypothetical protein
MGEGRTVERAASCALDCTEHDPLLFPSCSVAKLCARTSVFESKPLAISLHVVLQKLNRKKLQKSLLRCGRKN